MPRSSGCASASASRGGSPAPSSRASTGWPAVRARRRSRRASGCRSSRRWAAGSRWRARTPRSLPEVAGDAAELFDPRSVESMAAAIRAAARRRRPPGGARRARRGPAARSSRGSARRGDARVLPARDRAAPRPMSALRARRAQRDVPRPGRLGRNGDLPAGARAGAGAARPGAGAHGADHAPRRARAARGRLGGARARRRACGREEGERRAACAPSSSPCRVARAPRRATCCTRSATPARCGRVAARPHRARRQLLHHRRFRRRRVRVRATSAGAARRADGLIAVSAAARDEICRVLGLDPGASPLPRTARAARAGGAGAGREVRARHGLAGRRVVLCVRRSGRTRTRRCWSRRSRICPATWASCSRAIPRPTTRRLRGCAGARRRRARALPRATWTTPSWRGSGGWRSAPRSPPAPRASASRSSRRCATACRSRARTCRCCTRSAATSPRYFDPDDPAGAAAAIERAMADTGAAAAGGRAPPASRGRDGAADLEAYERALARG